MWVGGIVHPQKAGARAIGLGCRVNRRAFPTMQPIDSYREKGFFGSRRMELFEDRVVVTGYNAFVSDYQLIVPLATLEPTVNHLGIHEQIRLIGIVVFVGGGLGALSWGGHPPIYAHAGFWVCGLFSLFGFYLLLRSFRRIEAAAFFTSAGIHRLTIARIGPDTARFQNFVERIASQIALCRAVP